MFYMFMQKYFYHAKSDDFVLHYIPFPTADDYGKRRDIPTIAPTDFTFQNMPFVQNDKNNVGPSEDNMLVYLQMCDYRDMPQHLLPVSVSARFSL
jgi:hypothetical protein